MSKNKVMPMGKVVSAKDEEVENQNNDTREEDNSRDDLQNDVKISSLPKLAKSSTTRSK